MSIGGAGSVQGGFPLRPLNSVSEPEATPASSTPNEPRPIEDKVEISEAGKMFDQLNQSNEIQAERLAQIKQAIDNGTYETAEKLEAALDRLLDDIQGDDR